MFNDAQNHEINMNFDNPWGIVGNATLLARLGRDIRAGHMSHAYIIDGQEGSGKHAIAQHIASALACQNRPNRGAWFEVDADQISFDFGDAIAPPSLPDSQTPLPCGVCRGCRMVKEGICPDVHIIHRGGKATLGVDAVRHLRQDVYLGPSDMDTKLYIIEDAHTMTPQAQNALLLTLEEPPPYVVFLLLCNGADQLLETIRSRAPILRTQPISGEDMINYLKHQKVSLSEEEMAVLVQMADGCIGKALDMADAKSRKAIAKQRELVDAFVVACVEKRLDQLLATLNAFGNKRDEVSQLLSLVTLAFRDLLLAQKSEIPILKYYTDIQIVTELAAHITPKALMVIYDAVDVAQTELARNASVKLTLTKMSLQVGM